MATNWLVVEVEEGSDEGIAKLLSTEETAQEHIATRINGGIAPERLKLFAAADTPFGVAYQPIISIGSDGPKAPKPVATATGAPVTAPAKDAATATKEPAAVAAKDAPAEKKEEPAGTQDGVRFSSMFKNS